MTTNKSRTVHDHARAVNAKVIKQLLMNNKKWPTINLFCHSVTISDSSMKCSEAVQNQTRQHQSKVWNPNKTFIPEINSLTNLSGITITVMFWWQAPGDLLSWFTKKQENFMDMAIDLYMIRIAVYVSITTWIKIMWSDMDLQVMEFYIISLTWKLDINLLGRYNKQPVIYLPTVIVYICFWLPIVKLNVAGVTLPHLNFIRIICKIWFCLTCYGF